MLPEYIEPIDYIPQDMNSKLSKIELDQLENFFSCNLNTATCMKLRKEIAEFEFDPKSESLFKQIQKHLWDNYQFRYESGPGLDNELERALNKAKEDAKVFPIRVELRRYFDWKYSDGFGDSNSCYHVGKSNTVTRRFLNAFDSFRAIKVWKLLDGKPEPFGRALVLGNPVHEDFHIVFNSYPGHSEGKYHTFFAEALIHALKEKTGKEYKHKTVHFTHRSGGGWFYTNADTGCLIYPKEQQELADKVTEFTVDFGNKPMHQSIKKYKGFCIHCNVDVFDYDDHLQLNADGLLSHTVLCDSCKNRKDHKCQSCGNRGILVNNAIGKTIVKPELEGVVITKPFDLENKQFIYSCLACCKKNKYVL